MSDDRPTTVVVLIDVPVGGVAALQRYEDLVLPLLARHDGVLERRLRTADGTRVHVLTFASEAAYRGYLADPERLGHRGVLDGVSVGQRVLEGMVDLR
ncbi:hypothetical protein LY71_101346 [Geodermatophilus tzadiensis]|uniref:Antibiotic biosynthesis monooxygenase n=1 Tax=Geodermatophilus tzadiensis TaxID=1137988 RepID=A0A2T0U235_9ACTN|nr:hypothetical protein [Geodermatophilus tzadiensis]PRY51974.1 hypothetical protein LY71_101346 [Geodermatophilus tzadiensis]